MAQIIYKPHCSNCGAMIDDEIKYVEHTVINKISYNPLISVFPYTCAYCGKHFDSIMFKKPKKEQ